MGGGNAVRFLLPPGLGAELRRCHGRGHRPCHSARLIPGPPAAQSPRPAPAPPPAGASRPPGRALASVGAGGTGLGGSVPRGRGKRMRFLNPPGLGAEDQSPNHPPHSDGRGHRPCHSAPLIPGPPGAKAPGQRPPRPRRALACRWCGRHGSWWQRSARAGETQCVSGSHPRGQSLSPDREEFPGRQAAGLRVKEGWRKRPRRLRQ
jgi:hypothetical protein